MSPLTYSAPPQLCGPTDQQLERRTKKPRCRKEIGQSFRRRNRRDAGGVPLERFYSRVCGELNSTFKYLDPGMQGWGDPSAAPLSGSWAALKEGCREAKLGEKLRTNGVGQHIFSYGCFSFCCLGCFFFGE